MFRSKGAGSNLYVEKVDEKDLLTPQVLAKILCVGQQMKPAIAFDYILQQNNANCS